MRTLCSFFLPPQKILKKHDGSEHVFTRPLTSDHFYPTPAASFFHFLPCHWFPFQKPRLADPKRLPGDSAALQHRRICLWSRLALRPRELACQKSLNLDFKANSLRGRTGGEKKKPEKSLLIGRLVRG